MQDNVKNRMSDEPRKRGRPPNIDNVPNESVEAFPVLLQTRHVPPLICPLCNQGMVPSVLRWNNDVAMCACKSCGRRFDYTPPKVRPL